MFVAPLLAPALARAGIRAATAGLSEQTQADVALLTSEVVSNALRHGSTGPADEIVVRVSADTVVHIDVVDCGRLFEPPAPRQPWDARANGWGLFLLDQVADAWGIDTEPHGKRVLLELHPNR
jgi:anti-sigma regulatory factor (Ser/Thr protein kinase)